jgi:hypothetical protein
LFLLVDCSSLLIALLGIQSRGKMKDNDYPKTVIPVFQTTSYPAFEIIFAISLGERSSLISNCSMIVDQLQPPG